MKKSYIIMAAAAIVAAAAAVTVLFIFIFNHNAALKKANLTEQAASADENNADMAEAVFNDSVILAADGEKVSTTTVLIDGECFVPVDTITKSINKDATWDKNTKTITVADNAADNAISSAYWSKIQEIKAKLTNDDYEDKRGVFDYWIHDIDADGIPELIIQTGSKGYHCSTDVYTFDNNGIVYVGAMNDVYSILAVENVNARYLDLNNNGTEAYTYIKNGIYTAGNAIISYYVKENNTLTEYFVFGDAEVWYSEKDEGYILPYSLFSDKCVLDALIAKCME